jgi:hypothetical protein
VAGKEVKPNEADERVRLVEVIGFEPTTLPCEGERLCAVYLRE